MHIQYMHTHVCVSTCTCASLYISMVCCVETEWTGLFPTYCTWATSVSLWKLYARLRAWWLCVGVWISHLQKLWFSRSRFAYAHDMINCNTLSFLLSFTARTHAPMHTHPRIVTRPHSHMLTYRKGIVVFSRGNDEREQWDAQPAEDSLKERVLQPHLCCHCSRLQTLQAFPSLFGWLCLWTDCLGGASCAGESVHLSTLTCQSHAVTLYRGHGP